MENISSQQRRSGIPLAQNPNKNTLNRNLNAQRFSEMNGIMEFAGDICPQISDGAVATMRAVNSMHAIEGNSFDVLRKEANNNELTIGDEQVDLNSIVDPVTGNSLFVELNQQLFPLMVIAVTHMPATAPVDVLDLCKNGQAPTTDFSKAQLKNYYTAKCIIQCWISSLSRSLSDLIDPNYGLPVDHIDFYVAFKNTAYADRMGSVSLVRGANQPLDPIVKLLMEFELAQGNSEVEYFAINIALLYCYGTDQLFPKNFFPHYFSDFVGSQSRTFLGKQLLEHIFINKNEDKRLNLTKIAKTKFIDVVAPKSIDPVSYVHYLEGKNFWCFT